MKKTKDHVKSKVDQLTRLLPQNNIQESMLQRSTPPVPQVVTTLIPLLPAPWDSHSPRPPHKIQATDALMVM